MLGRWLITHLMFLVYSASFAANPQASKATLGDVFPLSQIDDKVYLSQTIWLSSGVVMPKGTQLITIFMMPRSGDTDVSRIEGRNKFHSATAERRGLADKEDSFSTALQQRAERKIWRDIKIFRGMLRVIDSRREDAFIVFRAPGEKENNQLPINFPEGTLWSENAGIITALWVRPGSRSEELGIKPGDRLVAVNKKTINSLIEADKNWRNSGDSAIMEKTWLISRDGSTREIHFGQSVSLQKSALDLL